MLKENYSSILGKNDLLQREAQIVTLYSWLL